MSNQLPDGEAVGLMFLRAELSTGLTLSKIALETKDKSKLERNRANATNACDALLHFAPGTTLSSEEAQKFEERIAQLKAALQELGEGV